MGRGIGNAFGFDSTCGFIPKKAIRSVRNRAWSAMLESVEKTC